MVYFLILSAPPPGLYPRSFDDMFEFIFYLGDNPKELLESTPTLMRNVRLVLKTLSFAQRIEVFYEITTRRFRLIRGGGGGVGNVFVYKRHAYGNARIISRAQTHFNY